MPSPTAMGRRQPRLEATLLQLIRRQSRKLSLCKRLKAAAATPTWAMLPLQLQCL